jgi:membrane protein insertase Oxa1/YidC/SpoIIIJ
MLGTLGTKVFVRPVHSCLFRNNERKMSIESIIQASVTGIHSMTTLPWWSTFALSTVFVRLSLLPIVRLNILAQKNLSLAAPDVKFLIHLWNKKIKTFQINQFSERTKCTLTLFRGIKACFTINKVSVMELISYPLINLSVFVSFILSLRSMIKNSDQLELNLHEGGMFWFLDMTSKDESFILPLTALSLSYVAIEIAFSKNLQMLRFLKDFFQTGIILSIPIISALPCGIFCYWIPSSLFALTQTLLLRHNKLFQKLLGM